MLQHLMSVRDVERIVGKGQCMHVTNRERNVLRRDLFARQGKHFLARLQRCYLSGAAREIGRNRAGPAASVQ